MYNKIYVFSPTIQATGGTELLQQLVFKLRQQGKDAYMYYTTEYNGSRVQKIFEPRYNNPYENYVDDRKDNLIIVSEASMYYLLNYKHIQKAVWWLSVDFYGGSFRLPCDLWHKLFYKLTDIIYRQFDKQWIHFTQSEYAYRYCIEERHINKNNVYHLSDYLSKDFINHADDISRIDRINQVLYNPKKGVEFTQQLMSKNPFIKWIPIINMTSTQIVELMKQSKVYIDFGNHPGKDRIPREAAICGCCIITGVRGAAANAIDIPIPSKYKCEEADIQGIVKIISEVFINFNECRKDFKGYTEIIKNEEAIFEKEVEQLFITHPHKYEKISKWEIFLRPIAKIVVYSMKFGPVIFGYDSRRFTSKN